MNTMSIKAADIRNCKATAMTMPTTMKSGTLRQATQIRR